MLKNWAQVSVFPSENRVPPSQGGSVHESPPFNAKSLHPLRRFAASRRAALLFLEIIAKMWAYRFVILLLSTVMPGLACTCSSYEPAKACAIFHTTPVIFSGRVIDHNDDKTGGFSQMTLYRFKVLEIFKGLPSSTKEVFIDPGSMTSCNTNFKSDADYLVYTGYSQPVMAVTVLKNYQPTSNTKQMPAAWKGLERLPIYDVGVCSPTRTIRGNDPDVAFLRSISKYGAIGNGWIEGRALQNISSFSLFSDYVAVSDAKFTVTSRSHESRTATVLPDGIFKIAAVPPGVYEVTAQSPVLGKGSVLGSPGIEVPPGGCALVKGILPNQLHNFWTSLKCRR